MMQEWHVRKVMIQGLPVHVTWKEVHSFFSYFGKVRYCHLKPPSQTPESRCSATLTFANPATAQNLFEKLIDFQGHVCKCKRVYLLKNETLSESKNQLLVSNLPPKTTNKEFWALLASKSLFSKCSVTLEKDLPALEKGFGIMTFPTEVEKLKFFDKSQEPKNYAFLRGHQLYFSKLLKAKCKDKSSDLNNPKAFFSKLEPHLPSNDCKSLAKVGSSQSQTEANQRYLMSEAVDSSKDCSSNFQGRSLNVDQSPPPKTPTGLRRSKNQSKNTTAKENESKVSTRFHSTKDKIIRACKLLPTSSANYRLNRQQTPVSPPNSAFC